MKTEEFDYALPECLIAQEPLQKRDDSKLLILNKKNGEIEHKRFFDIVDYIDAGDVLVMNNSKVIPARLHGRKEGTNAHIEILMLEERKTHIWECLVKPSKRLHEGSVIVFKKGLLEARCIEKKEEGICILEFLYRGNLYEILETLGEMPLPPYIHKKLEDKDRYQTVYATKEGSAAAPTAGLHFTEDILNRLKEKGVKVVPVTLHVGLGTFRPVNVEDVTKHKMHSEFYMMSKETAEILNEAKQSGHRIVAIGTTSTRTLETIMNLYGKFQECSGWTDIFIYPGYSFQAIDALITNFHLPKSTLLMLVSAFATKDYIMNAYQEAVLNTYRFFSFGDAMLIQ